MNSTSPGAETLTAPRRDRRRAESPARRPCEWHVLSRVAMIIANVVLPSPGGPASRSDPVRSADACGVEQQLPTVRALAVGRRTPPRLSGRSAPSTASSSSVARVPIGDPPRSAHRRAPSASSAGAERADVPVSLGRSLRRLYVCIAGACCHPSPTRAVVGYGGASAMRTGTGVDLDVHLARSAAR